MTFWLTQRNVFLCVLIFTTALIGTACVQLDVDPDPPYPQRDRDYTYPEEEDLPAPWVDPENYPVVTIVAPADGGFVDADQVTVTGTYAGPELASLTLNGDDVVLSGNSFSATLDLADGDVVVPIAVEAITAERGRASADRVTVFRGTAAGPDATATAGLGLDLENRGLDAIAETLASLIDGVDLADLLNPKIAADGKAGIEIKTARLEGIDLILRSSAEGLVIKVVIGNVELDVDVNDNPVLQLRIKGLIIEMLAEIVTDDEGALKIQVVDSNVSLASLGMNNDLLDEVASYVVSLLLDLLVDGLVPGLVEDLLAGLELNIAGEGYNLALAASAAVTTDRNLALAMDTTLAVTDPDLWTPGFQPEGYLSTASAPAGFPKSTPNTKAPYGLAVAVNDDFLNQLLYAVAGTGTLQLEVQEEFVTSEIASLLFFSFENIDPAKPLLLRFAPAVAPVAVGDADTNLMGLTLPAYTGQVLIDCEDDEVCLGQADADGYWEALSFTVDLTAPLALAFHPDNSFSLQLGELSIVLDMVHNAVGQNNIDNIERLLAEIFNDLLPELLGGLEDMTISLPELLDLDLVLADLATFGAQDDNLGIFIDLQ